MRLPDPLSQPDTPQAIAIEVIATQAKEEEKNLLACFLVDESTAREFAPRLRPENLSGEPHRTLVRAVQACLKRSVPLDLLAIQDVLTAFVDPEEVKPIYHYAVDLFGSIPTTAHAPYYFSRIMDKSARRELARLAHKFKAMAFDLAVEDPVTSAMALLGRIDTGTSQDSTVRHVADVLQSQVDLIEAAYTARMSGTKAPVPATGFYDLDQVMVLRRGVVIVVAGRPAMGKTAFAFQIACHVAEEWTALHVTLEVAGEELASRIISAEVGVTSHQQAHGYVPEESWAELAEAVERYRRLSLYIDDAPAASVEQIRAAILRLEATTGKRVDVLFIDYVGLIDQAGRDETVKISLITRAIKKLAKELGITIFLLSQLSRAVESRDNKRPVMSDLRQSGSIEQDADVVIFLYRDEYYNPQSKARGRAEAIIGKHRGGPIGTIELGFDGSATRFSNVEYEPNFEEVPPGDNEF